MRGSGPQWGRSATPTTALCESFFASLECELIEQQRFRTQAEAKMAVFAYIEGWYNPHRRHSGLGQKSPLNFERGHAHAA